MFQIMSRRSFIKMTSLLPVALFLKPSNVQACPWCVRVALACVEREAAVGAIEALATDAIVGMGERAIIGTVFRATTARRILAGMRIMDKTEDATRIMNALDKVATGRPELVASYEKYQNDVEVLWTAKDDNEVLIEVISPTDSKIDTTLSIVLKNKETDANEFVIKPVHITLLPNVKSKFKMKISSGTLITGVKDVVVDINQSNVSSIVKTIFVV